MKRMLMKLLAGLARDKDLAGGDIDDCRLIQELRNNKLPDIRLGRLMEPGRVSIIYRRKDGSFSLSHTWSDAAKRDKTLTVEGPTLAAAIIKLEMEIKRGDAKKTKVRPQEELLQEQGGGAGGRVDSTEA